MKLPLKHSALAIVAGTLAAIMLPPQPLAPSDWAPRHFVLPDGERKGELIDLSRTPHLIEPLDALGPDASDNEVVVRKSAQTGFTTLLQIAIAHSVDQDPCDMLIVQPTDGALSDFNSQKLGRAIDLSRALGETGGARTWGVKIAPQTTRSVTASTTYEKKFGISSIVLALATSSADLRSKTSKKVFCDEIDEYPDDLNKQGSPLDMAAARQIQFLKSGAWKRAYISTPRLKGASKIDDKYQAGDQRLWYVQCPQCAERFTFDCLEFSKFAPFDERTPGLKFSKAYPFNSYFVAPCCGVPIQAAQKSAVYLTGEWRPTAEAPGRCKSYHFGSLSAPAVPWDAVAKEFNDVGDDQQKLKTFCNLWLGLPYEEKGDAPDWQPLLERKGGYPDGQIPPRGLLFVAGADVQHNGIWVEAVAFAPNQESWTIRHEFLEGDTTDPRRGAFEKLATFFEGKFPDAFGGMRELDAISVDAGDGGRFSQVLAWCRVRAHAFAIKGVPGWHAPALGTPIKVDINLNGQKVAGGGTLWPVGGWSLKSTFHANLRKPNIRTTEGLFPNGFCHFHDGVDERYMRQMTSEHLANVTFRGRTTQIWKETGPNHLLDCRIYAMAVAEYLGLSRLSPEQWAELARYRGVPQSDQADMFAPAPVQVEAASAAVAAAAESSAEPAPAPQQSAGWIERTAGWWGQR